MNSKTTAAKLLNDIEKRLKLLQKFEGKGRNPKAYVRQLAGYAKTDLHRLQDLLGLQKGDQ